MSRPALEIVPLDSFEVRPVRWLDAPFLQWSAFQVIAGRKGVCKGTLTAREAARVSTGQLYPSPRRVLVVTSEDSVELDFKPRVLAAGGDPSRISIVKGPFRMPDDLAWLEESARRLEDVGLIVIDPLGSHLGGKDTDREGLVREAIGPLNDIADRLECLILGVRHLGKDVSRGALSSVLGSTAFVDVPRCVVAMALDDEDPMLVHVQVVAGNRGPRGSAARAYRIELVDVPPAKDITRVVPIGESTKSVETLLAGSRSEKPSSRSNEAAQLILGILEREGPQESDALDARVAAEVDLARRTVQNVRVRLGREGRLRNAPEKDESGAVVRWIVAPSQVTSIEESNPPKRLETATSRPDPLESVVRDVGYPPHESEREGCGRDVGATEPATTADQNRARTTSEPPADQIDIEDLVAKAVSR